jgi:hypothetical protein
MHIFGCDPTQVQTAAFQYIYITAGGESNSNSVSHTFYCLPATLHRHFVEQAATVSAEQQQGGDTRAPAAASTGLAPWGHGLS